MMRALWVMVILLGILNPLQARERHDFAYSNLLLAAHAPSGQYVGAFEGQDLDADGMLETGELSYFKWNGTTYIDGGVTACTVPGFQCPVFSFLYPGAGHGVFFYVHKYADGTLLEETIVGKYINYARESGSGKYAAFYGQTVFYLDGQLVPVPEPSAALLVLGGLALLGGIHALRTRRPGAHRHHGVAA